MTPFEKALLQAVNDDFAHVPPEVELDFSPITVKKATKPRPNPAPKIAEAGPQPISTFVKKLLNKKYPTKPYKP